MVIDFHMNDFPGNGGGFVFDCRVMPNPYWDEALRGYTGRDKPIADFFDRIPARSVYFAERLAGIDGVACGKTTLEMIKFFRG